MLTKRQREHRRRHIGASESPAICGVSRFLTVSDIYWRKVSDEETETDSPAMETGRRLENALIDFAVSRCNLTNVRRNQFRVSRDEPILAATCDALGDGFVIEAKTSSQVDLWGDDGTDEVPDDVLVQVNHQMFVTGASVAFVPVLLAGRHFEWRLYRVARHQKLIEGIVNKCVSFWRNHVEPRVPPTDDPPPLDVLRARRRDRREIVLSSDADQLIDELNVVRAEISRLESEREKIQRRLIDMLVDADVGVCPSGRRVTYGLVTRQSVDLSQLRMRYPQIVDDVVRVSEYRVFRVSDKKKESCNE